MSRGSGRIPCTVEVLSLDECAEHLLTVTEKAEHNECRFGKFDGIRMRKLFSDCICFVPRKLEKSHQNWRKVIR